MTAKMQATAKSISELLERPLQLLGELLKNVDTVALLDFPAYGNVGDSMIWLGQVALLRRLHKKIVYICTLDNFDAGELARVQAAGAALLLTGGGNFGTLWPHHQAFRERVMTLFPHALIVQMPQSICFENDEALQRAQRAIASCSNLHLLVRDHPSYAFARDNFSTDIALCPDSAFFLGDLHAPAPACDIIYLRRSDKEADALRGNESIASNSITVTDWRKPSWMEKQLQRFLYHGVRLGLLRNTQDKVIALYNLLARMRTKRGIDLLARGRCIITDRLHAHVLGVLLKRPSYILDNSNGKVFAFYEAWTRDLGVSRCATSLREALRMATVNLFTSISLLQMFLQDDGVCAPLVNYF